jgi:hypothetical protein
MTLRRPAPLQKKKLAPSLSDPSHRPAVVHAIADFPDPAAPFSQQMGQSSCPSAHSMIFPMISQRVPSRHPPTPSILSYAASVAMCGLGLGSKPRLGHGFRRPRLSRPRGRAQAVSDGSAWARPWPEPRPVGVNCVNNRIYSIHERA